MLKSPPPPASRWSPCRSPRSPEAWAFIFRSPCSICPRSPFPCYGRKSCACCSRSASCAASPPSPSRRTASCCRTGSSLACSARWTSVPPRGPPPSSPPFSKAAKSTASRKSSRPPPPRWTAFRAPFTRPPVPRSFSPSPSSRTARGTSTSSSTRSLATVARSALCSMPPFLDSPPVPPR